MTTIKKAIGSGVPRGAKYWEVCERVAKCQPPTFEGRHKLARTAPMVFLAAIFQASEIDATLLQHMARLLNSQLNEILILGSYVTKTNLYYDARQT